MQQMKIIFLKCESSYLHSRPEGKVGQTRHQLSRMMSSNVKVPVFALNNFEQKADSAFARFTSVVEKKRELPVPSDSPYDLKFLFGKGRHVQEL